jgi:hypothetical protein
LYHIHPPTTFHHLLLPPTGTTHTHPSKTCFALLFSNFVKEKKMTVLFV